MVTIGLYYSAAAALGFDVQEIVKHEEQRLSEVRESIQPAQCEGDAG